MERRFPNSLLTFTCCALVAVSATLAADAVTSPPVRAKQYAALDSLPDWSGVWTLDPASLARLRALPPPALKGEYKRAFEAWRAEVRATNGQVTESASHCLPPGMPAIMAVAQYPLEFFFTPGRVTTHHEAWMQWRNIYTDGRAHPEDFDPAFNGHSIGHWEGDSLVVDTIAIKTSVPMAPGVTHSEKMRIIERMQLAKDDSDLLRIEMTIEDPLALEKPWVRSFSFRRTRDTELIEFICEENDRNRVDESGRTQFD